MFLGVVVDVPFVPLENKRSARQDPAVNWVFGRAQLTDTPMEVPPRASVVPGMLVRPLLQQPEAKGSAKTCGTSVTYANTCTMSPGALGDILLAMFSCMWHSLVSQCELRRTGVR